MWFQPISGTCCGYELTGYMIYIVSYKFFLSISKPPDAIHAVRPKHPFSLPELFFMSRPVWPAGHYVSGWSVLPSVRPSILPSVRHALGVSTHYHACIAMPTWCRCAPPILFWLWPPYSLLPRSCLTWILFVDPHWWVPLCVQRPGNTMHFQQIIMHALQCQHDVDVHLLFYFDLDLHITSSRGHV